MTTSSVHGSWRGARRSRFVAAGCAVAALCAVAAAPAVAHTGAGHGGGGGGGGGGGPKPTIVLVHGAFADGSSWNGVIKRLERRGYQVIAPTNPLRGLYNDSTYIASVLESIKGPIVLAGHSYGGAVISSAAAGNPRVKSLVYIAALMPDVGESAMSLGARFPSALGTAIRSVPYREGGGRRGTDVYLKRDKVHSVFAACLPAGEANLLAATQQPVTTAAFSERARVAAWRTIPSWALVARQDMAINPDQERFEAKRAHSHTVEVNSCHVSLIADPGSVAGLILQAATAAESTRPALADTGTARHTRDMTGLGGITGASLAAGSAAVLLGRRLRRRTD